MLTSKIDARVAASGYTPVATQQVFQLDPAQYSRVGGAMSPTGQDTLKPKIFIGSSLEALDKGLVKNVSALIKDAGLEPYPWNDFVKAGDLLLQRLERLPGELHGAVILATEDESFKRKKKNERGTRPVPNVIFEYGYLSARLTPRRVALCTFGEVKIPSDLQGLTVIRSRDRGKSASLSKEAAEQLSSWLSHLSPLGAQIPPALRTHGYSGRWQVENNFSLWRGQVIEKPDRVYFSGETHLSIVSESEGAYGSGMQMGKLFIKVGKYRATYQFGNEVIRANVAEDGTLKMRLVVKARECIEEEGVRPEGALGGRLFGSNEFELELAVVPGASRKLVGRHEYRIAGELHQAAVENYTYIGI